MTDPYMILMLGMLWGVQLDTLRRVRKIEVKHGKI